MTDEEIQDELQRVIERAKLHLPLERNDAQMSAAHAANAAIERAIRYDARARQSPDMPALKSLTREALRDALTFAIAAYILELEETEQ